MAPEGLAEIATLAVNTVVTDMVITLEVAGEPETQAAFDVITQVILSPLTRAFDVYVELVAPDIAVPFLYH